MAEKSMPSHVNEILTCALCSKILNNPQTLQCLHSYCLGCLNVLKQNSIGYQCTQCRRSTSPKDVRIVPYVVQLLETHSARNKETEGTNCDSCKDKPAKWKCMNCVHDNYQCDSCKSIHDKFMMRASQKHQVFSLDDIPSNRVDRPMYCDKHQDQKLDMFCTECNQVTCVLCKVMFHDGHKSTSVTEELKDTLNEMDNGVFIIEDLVLVQQKEIAELKRQWEQTDKEFDEQLKLLEKQYKDAQNKLLAQYCDNSSYICEKRNNARKHSEMAIAEKEIKIEEETQFIRWIKATRENDTGAGLVKAFQENVVSKLRSYMSSHPKYQSRFWGISVLRRGLSWFGKNTTNNNQ